MYRTKSSNELVFKIKMQYTGIMAFKKKSAQSLWKQKKKKWQFWLNFPSLETPHELPELKIMS